MLPDFVWLAMQDTLQVALVVVCVFVGWTAWSVMLHVLDPVSTGAKFSDKSVEFIQTKTEDASSVANQGSAKSESKNYVGSGARSGLDILEHYGVLGAPPGAWRARADAAC